MKLDQLLHITIRLIEISLESKSSCCHNPLCMHTVLLFPRVGCVHPALCVGVALLPALEFLLTGTPENHYLISPVVYQPWLSCLPIFSIPQTYTRV